MFKRIKTTTYAMETLEDSIRLVSVIAEDLKATKVTGKKEGHLESLSFYANIATFGYGSRILPLFKVVDNAVETEPDYERRGTARARLQDEYTCSEHYSARYLAGVAIGIEKTELESMITSWCTNLTDIIDGIERSTTETSLGSPSDPEAKKLVLPSMRRINVDHEKAVAAAEDLSMIYRLSGSSHVKGILEHYYKKDTPEIRDIAGESLGKSPLRRFMDEHYKLATAVDLGIIAGAAIGIGYLI